ncbi:hypothetical protein WBJ53_33220 (plasmid) [Spirosoma sp. SC4-14]|uniref:hypothetical protein n=1 Tax=Spirosoma sp. SC4-14 TaxID=3128900 RepID=UPI0030D3F031
MKQLFFCLLTLTTSVMAQTPIRKLTYDTEYTAEQILNGKLPRRKPSPPVKITYDTTGFARERLYHVPAPGIHPRIFFAPQDIPRIKKQLAGSDAGRQMLGYVREQLAAGIDKPGTWENTLFVALEKGDINTFRTFYRDESNKDRIVPGNAGSLNPKKLPATTWHHRDAFTTSLMLKAFVCLIDNNGTEGKALGRVIASYSRYLEPKIDQEAETRYGSSWWRSVRNVVGEHPHLAYAYDWAYNFLSTDDARQVRKVLSKITKGRTTLGMELPAHWRNWNYMGISMYFPLYSLAIEGEDGYDPRIYKRSVEVVRDFITYSINPSGMAHEAVGYHTGGFTHTTKTMLAMANRGDNLFTHANFRQQFDAWMLNALQPYGKTWYSDGDLANFAPATEATMVVKYFFPNDKKLDFVYQNIPEVSQNNFRHDYFMDVLLLCPADPDKNTDGKLVDYQAGKTFNLPKTYADENRGVMMTRSNWTPDALYLNFECHPDIVMASHDHADHGRFVLSGLGRTWAWETSRPHNTEDHSCVIIDSLGQGYFNPPGKWLGMIDTPEATFSACDAKYAFDWRWEKEIGMWDSTDTRLDNKSYVWAKNNVRKMAPYKNLVEYDPSPAVVGFYKDYLDGNPRQWDEDSWVVRLPHNPVQRAFRTAGLVRGLHDYALIMDDIQKDNQPHIYSWLMQVPTDVTLVSQQTENGQTSIILGEKNGDRKLLVRFVDAITTDKSVNAVLEDFAANYQLAGQSRTVVTNPRLRVSTTCKAPDFKVLLFPFRTEADLPQTSWNTDKTRLTVSWNGQVDKYTCTKGPDGRTRLTLQRAGNVISLSR